MLVSNLRQRGTVKLFATTLRGEFGASTEVEISAVTVTRSDPMLLGFTVRDVGRRLQPEAACEASSSFICSALAGSLKSRRGLAASTPSTSR